VKLPDEIVLLSKKLKLFPEKHEEVLLIEKDVFGTALTVIFTESFLVHPVATIVCDTKYTEVEFGKTDGFELEEVYPTGLLVH